MAVTARTPTDKYNVYRKNGSYWDMLPGALSLRGGWLDALFAQTHQTQVEMSESEEGLQYGFIEKKGTQ